MAWQYGEDQQTFPAEEFSGKFGTKVSYTYKLPDGITEHQLGGLLKELRDSSDEDRLGDLMIEAFTILTKVMQDNPKLRVHCTDFRHVHDTLCGVASRFHPNDIQFYVMEWMAGLYDRTAHPFDAWHTDYRNTIRKTEEVAGLEIQWVPSPEVLQVIHDHANEKSHETADV